MKFTLFLHVFIMNVLLSVMVVDTQSEIDKLSSSSILICYIHFPTNALSSPHHYSCELNRIVDKAL